MRTYEERTFENDRIFRPPDVPEGSGILTRLKVDTTRPIGKHMYRGYIHKILDRVASKVIPICLLASREGLIKVRVLLEGYALVALAAAKIPENVCHVKAISKHL